MSHSVSAILLGENVQNQLGIGLQLKACAERERGGGGGGRDSMRLNMLSVNTTS